MTKTLKSCLAVILFCTFSILACKKATVETNPQLAEALSTPPPPTLCLGTCNISSVPNFSNWFGETLTSPEGELRSELAAKPPAAFTFTYDANNNPATCAGLSPGACYFMYYNSTFNYTNGDLTSILVDNTYGNIGCPSYTNLPNIHTGTRIDFAYSLKKITGGGISFYFPVINATVYKSDTVPLGQNFNIWTASGRTYYYEYGLLGFTDNQLKVKRYKADAISATKEYNYTYDSVGHLTKVSMFEGGTEKTRITIYGFDTKKNFASGNTITQLLTSTYGKNNSKQWYTQSWVGTPSTHFYSAVYGYNSHCYPISATVTFDGQTSVDPAMSYTCY